MLTRERAALAVEDAAAGRDQQALVDPVVLGQQAVLGALLHLEVVEAAAQRTEQRQLRRRPARCRGG